MLGIALLAVVACSVQTDSTGEDIVASGVLELPRGDGGPEYDLETLPGPDVVARGRNAAQMAALRFTRAVSQLERDFVVREGSN